MSTIQRRYDDSPYAVSADSQGLKVFVRNAAPFIVRAASATTTTISANGSSTTIAVPVDDVMALIDPIPDANPPVDISNELVRMSPDGTQIAHQLPPELWTTGTTFRVIPMNGDEPTVVGFEVVQFWVAMQAWVQQ